MKKKTKKNFFLAHKKITALLSGVALVLLVGFSFLAAKIVYISDAANQASIAPIRELLIMAAENLKKDVPVDAKTGDLYFPESKLFLPNPKSNLKLTYAWYPAADGSQEELSVSLSQVPGITDLYSARNTDEIFRSVPKLQSCSRGVKLLHNKTNNDDSSGQLKKAVVLQNGKELYMYTEKDCPELDEVVDLLSNIQSY